MSLAANNNLFFLVCTDLVISEEEQSNFDTIIQEVCKKKWASKEENNLGKRQDRLIETITSIIKNTTSIQEIESLEVIAASMTPTVAAVRESNHLTHAKSFVSKGNSSAGNIIPQRRFFSTKKKNNRSTTQLEKPADSCETNDIALRLLL